MVIVLAPRTTILPKEANRGIEKGWGASMVSTDCLLYTSEDRFDRDARIGATQNDCKGILPAGELDEPRALRSAVGLPCDIADVTRFEFLQCCLLYTSRCV